MKKFKRDKKMLKKLKKNAKWIIDQLKKEGFIVHRYDSFSSNSIYLKIDYGACYSIRISDHKGKKHLSYKYNVLSCCPDLIATKNADGKVKYYFPLDAGDILIKKVLYDKRQLLKRCGSTKYRELMNKRYIEGLTQKGFWESARVV